MNGRRSNLKEVEPREQPTQAVQTTAPTLQSAKPTAAAETYIARSGEVKEVPGNGNHRANIIVVEIKAAGSWQETCRRTVKTANNFPGKDSPKNPFSRTNLNDDFP